MVPVISAENLKVMSIYMLSLMSRPMRNSVNVCELHLMTSTKPYGCHGERAYHIIDTLLRQK
jgi:hypothetical protein